MRHFSPPLGIWKADVSCVDFSLFSLKQKDDRGRIRRFQIDGFNSNGRNLRCLTVAEPAEISLFD